MSKKSALGKGLSALLPSEEERDEEREKSSGDDVSRSQLYRFEDGNRLVGRVAEVEVENIRPNPYQPRQEFSEDALEELAASIEQLGIIQPITVRALGEGQFEIISGERRLRAARRAGLPRVPAFVRKANTEQMLEMALVENVQREELNPIEVALGYQRLMEECGLTQEQVSEKVSKSRATVANFLRLLRLPPRIQAALRDKEVAMGHARALITIDDHDAQIDLLKQTIEEDLSVRDVERRVRAYQQAQEEAEAAEQEGEDQAEEETGPSRDDLQLEEYRNQLRSRFSTQVNIRHKSDGEGKIEISYYSAEDLERLIDMLEG
ncbi:chromosome partitioning protein ParB [Longibacter salinarum]|uniref:Chromosome partitioning protein ParB n=1 Tax=Longibacter salinarum TaxID=1850348 RepID=A0A2A8CWV2_9BACT|nr:ParB/RepB/Spo0J family partition protein [Longibacter salinarum]PEN13077.1 chromosome partitioning protein ParB [Longibacter salinarum]